MTAAPGAPLPSQSLPSRLVRQAKATALSVVRSGPATVLFPNANARLGNLFYDWLHAAQQQAAGRDYRVVITDATLPWVDLLPRVRDELLVDRTRVGLRDRRDVGYFQRFGADYSEEELAAFCHRYVLGSPLLEQHRERAARIGVGDPQTVTVNVRRGDYYSVPEFRERYGFDVARYVAEALEVQRAAAPVTRIHVVSDEVAWCREHLGFLADGARLSFEEDDRSPASDFATLALSRRLVLTNSTFSYWGGYASQSRCEDAVVVAPSFHARNIDGGRSFHLHPGWHVLDGYGEE